MTRFAPALLFLALPVACKPRPAWLVDLRSPDPAVRARACLSILPSHHKSPPPELLAALADKEAPVRRAALRGVLGFILRSADPTALPALARMISEDPDESVRLEALRTLGTLSHRSVVPTLAGLLARPTGPRIREQVLAILARAADRRALPALLPLLQEKKPAPMLFEVLRRIGDRSAAEHVAPLAGHADPAVRAQAIRTLGVIGDRASVPKLVEALGDSDTAVVRAAIRAVAALGSAQAVPALLKLADHAEARIRVRAIRALAEYRRPEVIPADEAAPVVLKHLSDAAEEVRIEAARVLGAVRLKRALVPLSELAGPKNPRAVRVAALDALGRIGDAGALPALVSALSARDDDVRTAAARALGAMGKTGAGGEAALVAAYRKGEGNIGARIQIASALGRIGAVGAVPTLLEMGRRDPVPIVRAEAGGALLRLRRHEGVEILRPILLEARDWQERRAAALALEQREWRERLREKLTAPVQALIRDTSHLITEALRREKDPLVREVLYRQLAKARGATAVAYQRRALSETVPFFRLMAASGLCLNGEADGCDALIAALQHPEATVRAEAARRLGWSRQKRAAAALRKLLDDPVLFVANAARRALAQMDRPPPRP